MHETAVQYTAKELQVARACYLNNNQNFNANDRNINNYNSAVRGIAQYAEAFYKMQRNLWGELCSYDNLYLAYKKVRKHKTTRDYVIEFEKDLEGNLLLLRTELLLHSYRPKPLVSFIIKDPKTRKISKSDFRDRIVHHALCNIIEPLFDKGFIYDSYANRKGKGTLAAVKRLDYFKREATRNNIRACYVLKGDIKTYFENVDHNILISIIKKKIKDRHLIWLIKIILFNYNLGNKHKGMPLGNLTSQFFANVYLNELDWFVKHKLKVRYYIRYVDDFVILSQSKYVLTELKEKIDLFLNDNLCLKFHPNKTRIIVLGKRFTFLGFRMFYYHKLLKASNIRMMKTRFKELRGKYLKKMVDYNLIYDFIEGWFAYARQADTYKLRNQIASNLETSFPGQISIKEINRLLRSVSNPKSL